MRKCRRIAKGWELKVYRDDRNFGTIDLVGVPFLVGGLAFDKKIAKYIMAVVVIIVNYILREKNSV